MNILESNSALNAMIVAAKSVEAFNRFYAEDVVAQENDKPERKRRESWMQARADPARRTGTHVPVLLNLRA
jgi:hypothetical protein